MSVWRHGRRVRKGGPTTPAMATGALGLAPAAAAAGHAGEGADATTGLESPHHGLRMAAARAVDTDTIQPSSTLSTTSRVELPSPFQGSTATALSKARIATLGTRVTTTVALSPGKGKGAMHAGGHQGKWKPGKGKGSKAAKEAAKRAREAKAKAAAAAEAQVAASSAVVERRRQKPPGPPPSAKSQEPLRIFVLLAA